MADRDKVQRLLNGLGRIDKLMLSSKSLVSGEVEVSDRFIGVVVILAVLISEYFGLSWSDSFVGDVVVVAAGFFGAYKVVVGYFKARLRKKQVAIETE